MDLFPHQDTGASFLSEKGGTKGLFFGMGTGKTITALEAYARSDANQLLVIAPPIALPMWHSEASAYLFDEKYPPTITVLSKTSTRVPADADAEVLIVSYDIARRRSAELRDWADTDCTALVCDESHALKDASAKRTAAVLGAKGIASGAHYTWLLTGTPITRWNDDLYPFLCRADMQGLQARCGGSALHRFKLRYTIQQDRQFSPRARPVKMVVGNRYTAELSEWVYGEGLALRVDLKEVFESMPPLTRNRYDIELDASPELKARLKAMEKSNIADIQRKLKANEPHLASVRRELGMAMVKGSVKEIKARVDSGQAVLVGAWHTSVIEKLRQELSSGAGLRVRVIDGGTSSTGRAEAEQLWNAGELDVLVCQIAAAGVSLNLQRGGHQIVVVEEDWSPSMMDQFYARLWRYGQENPVHVDTLTSDNKLAQAIGRISATKAREHSTFNRQAQADD